MKIKEIMNSATMGEKKRLRPMIFWTILEYSFRGAPYGILLMVIWELFLPLQYPGTSLNVDSIIFLWIALLISVVLLYIVGRKAYFATYYKSYELGAEGRVKMGEHLRKLPMGFYNSRDPGDIGAYLITDYANVEQLLGHALPQIFGAVAMPSIMIICLFFINWQLALVTFLVIPFALCFASITFIFVKIVGKKHQKTKIQAHSRMIEYIQGIRLIKAFNLRGTKFDRLEKTFRNLKSKSIKLEAGAGPTLIFSALTLYGGLTAITLFGLTFLLSGTLSLPFYIMFLIIGMRVYEPLIQVFMFAAELSYYALSVQRIEDLRKTPILSGIDAHLEPKGFNIEFKNISFRYHSTDVLKDITVSIPERSFTALVGPSGSGKTTFTRLIARFWDVDQGTIYIGGKDIKSYDPDKVLALIAIVFQDVYLFNDSIINNIRVGKKDATMEEIIETAKKARCHEFINALPDKYDTIVGEGGSTLSGGEKQRISIARAMLKDAPIVLLDEATAFLDPENELFIQEAIDGLLKDKTVIVIAHRLNSIRDADKIIVLDKGTIIEEGTHETLMGHDGLYNHMWAEQQRTRGWKF
jgi:ATP-binding cassette subfamily B protein